MPFYTFKSRDFYIIILLILVLIIYVTVNRYVQSVEPEKSEVPSSDEQGQSPDDSPVPIQTSNMVSPKDVRISEADYLFLDIRTIEEFDLAHIRGSAHISAFTEPSVEDSRTILLISRGTDAQNTTSGLVESLKGKGYKVAVLGGDITSYQAVGGIIIHKIDPTNFSDQTKITYVEPRDLTDSITQTPDDIYIIDVRRSGNYERGHVPGAKSIPIESIEILSDTIPLEKQLYVYGTDALQSFTAGALVHDLGFLNAKTLNGGFSAWEKFNYPIEIN